MHSMSKHISIDKYVCEWMQVIHFNVNYIKFFMMALALPSNKFNITYIGQ